MCTFIFKKRFPDAEFAVSRASLIFKKGFPNAVNKGGIYSLHIVH